jgi:hypothetical protein
MDDYQIKDDFIALCFEDVLIASAEEPCPGDTFRRDGHMLFVSRVHDSVVEYLHSTRLGETVCFEASIAEWKSLVPKTIENGAMFSPSESKR